MENTEEKKPQNPKAFPDSYNYKGMDLRDYFAAKAMQAIISNSDSMRELTRAYERGNKTLTFQESISNLAFSYSDAMLKQREL